MKNWISALLVVFLGASLAGCSTMERPNPDSSKEYIGMFSGAIVGGLAGSAIGEKGGGRVTAISIGAVVGALIGCGLGMYLDDLDRDKVLVQQNKGLSAGNDRQQLASNWQHSSSPIVSQVAVAVKAPTEKNQIAENKEPTAVKAMTATPVAENKEPAAVKAMLAKPVAESRGPYAAKAVTEKSVAENRGPYAAKPVAESKEPAAVKPMIDEKKLSTLNKTVDKKAADKKEPDKKEAAAKSSTVNDKILSLWHNLPSTQWFVNDVKQDEVG